MGTYITISNLTETTDETELKQCLDTSDLTTDAKALKAISRAESVADDYISPFYDTPLSSPTETFKLMICYLAIYFIYNYRYRTDVPENVTLNYKEAMSYFKKINENTFQIPDTDYKDDSDIVIVSNKSSTSKVFTSTKLAQIL